MRGGKKKKKKERRMRRKREIARNETNTKQEMEKRRRGRGERGIEPRMEKHIIISHLCQARKDNVIGRCFIGRWLAAKRRQ